MDTAGDKVAKTDIAMIKVAAPNMALQVIGWEIQAHGGGGIRRLARSAYLGGNEYSIADMATFPWLRSWQNQGIVLDEYPHLKA